MNDLFTTSAYFSVALTLVCFAAAEAMQRKWKQPLLNPILVAAAMVMGMLQLLKIPNAVYQEGCRILTWLLTPATICLSISFYQQFQKLKKHLAAIAAGVIAGSMASIAAVWGMCKAFRLDSAVTASLLPKSVTTAIGAAISSEIGGIAAITTAVIVITGVLGNILGPVLSKWFRFDDEITKGVAFGTASHVVGTSKAAQIGQLCGAVSSLSLVLAGIVTCILLSFLAQFLV